MLTVLRKLAAFLSLLGLIVAPALQAQPAAGLVRYAALPVRAALAPVMDCAALRGRGLPTLPDAGARVLSAEVVPAAKGRAEMCLLKGYVAPNIHFELHLPTTGYTGRYLQGGCGGNCGAIRTGFSPACDDAQAFSGAFAVGFEDSGHTGGDGIWALGGEQVRADFSYRAAHVFSIAAKALIGLYYGQPPAYAYFQGCSDGGREAMMEAQRYPTDFNGLVAGSPATIITEAMERFLWEARWGHDDAGRMVFDKAALETLHGAVMAACDGLDGVKDGQIDEPRACHFDPKTIVCGPQRADACLTPQQADVARRFYQGPVDAQGVHLYPGGEPYGAELTWGGRGGLTEAGIAMMDENVRTMMFLGTLPESVTLKTWGWDVPTLRALQKHGAIYDADNPDLKPLRDAGGKLIIWYGAADPAAGVDGMPDYYARLRDAVGGLDAARAFVRMFPVPGMYHCRDGYIPYQANMLGSIVNWVEQAHAPDQIMASALLPDGTPRHRPVFAYPVRATYKGKGDVNDPASFAGKMPATLRDDHYVWAGAAY
ncbi:tannase/feruloyl esterase family alpha/beta hydrolase [Novosphingobium rosa]|uniref:tannase/feruloyl esterase family alpha/beta hydrolase n=1 Tax=Novosphingobium rosa TaxID=76978 RepID=UPI000837A0FD|nr:tannase/feruloyl esterase family alpha/beta hydrolase [Novosphingobium rosa]